MNSARARQMGKMTRFQTFAWRRWGFIITDNHRPQTIRGTRYAPSTLIERGGGSRPAGSYEVQLWGSLRAYWHQRVLP